MYSNREIWRVSYPIFLSLLAQNIINVTNTAFLGRVGEVELGASAIGGLFYICLFTVAFGFSVGSQIVIARRNGEKRYDQIGPIVNQGVVFLLVLAACMFAIYQLGGHSAIRLMISSDQIIQATTEFLDIRIYGFFFSFLSVIFRAFYVGITRTKVLTANAIVMALVHVVLDYTLIFGNFGFSAMGLKGAAYSSVIAEAISILFFVVFTLKAVNLKKYAMHKLHAIDFKLLKRVLGISVFTMFQYFISMGTYVLFFIIVEHLGQRELAVANIVRSIYIVLYIPISALSTTTNSFVSNTLGAGYTERVMPLIRKISRLNLLIMTVASLLICLMPRLVLSIYTNDPNLINEGVDSVYVIAGAMLLHALSNIYFSGISGTGNTRSALALELVVLVCYTAYIYVVGIVLKLSVASCFTSELVYSGLLLILSVIYLKKASWQKKQF